MKIMLYFKRHFTQFLSVLLAVIVGLQIIRGIQLYATDPLTVVYHKQPDQTLYLKSGETFTFSRDVCVNQDLDVTVHREFHNLETGNKYMLSGIRYVAYAKDGCYTAEFSASVPLRIPAGTYEYRPILIYDVNQNLTISKPAPIVRVEVYSGS